MRHLLKPHPDLPCEAVTRIEVEVSRTSADRLLLTYRLAGTIADLLLPSATVSERADRLWEHSCFEAFLSAGAGTAYYEFNFSPSTQWAAYRLEDYRSGMTAAAADPHLEFGSSADWLELGATLQLPPDIGTELGLSAVIEERDGRKSYWALAHPPGEPDFHHGDCFAAELPEMTDR
jgi:hypothetical protein